MAEVIQVFESSTKVPCSKCGSTHLLALADSHGAIALVICLDCGKLLTSPVPTSEVSHG